MLRRVGWALYLWLCATVGTIAFGADVEVNKQNQTWPELPPLGCLKASIKVNEGGRLCAVSPLVAYSAKHVWNAEGSTTWRNLNRDVQLTPYFFKDIDLVRLTSPEPFPYFSPLAASAPYVGSTLTALGPANEDAPVLWKVDVIGPWTLAKYKGTYLASLGATPAGSSGGCLCDEAGNVVGVVVGLGAALPNERVDIFVPITFSVPLWGGWAKRP